MQICARLHALAPGWCVQMKHTTAFRQYWQKFRWISGHYLDLPIIYLTQSKNCALSVTLCSSACWGPRQGRNLRSCSQSGVYNYGQEIEKNSGKEQQSRSQNRLLWVIKPEIFQKSRSPEKTIEISWTQKDQPRCLGSSERSASNAWHWSSWGAGL